MARVRSRNPKPNEPQESGYKALTNIDLDVHLLGMSVFMTVPMVIWMRIRGQLITLLPRC